MIWSPEIERVDAGTISVDNFPATQAVSGSVSVSNFPATQNVAVTNTPTVSVNNFPGATVASATVTNVSVGTTSTTLAASNPSRVRLIVYNETGTLYVKFGATASNSSYTYRLTAGTTLEFSQYSGLVTAIKASGTTAVLVTEL